MTMIKNKNKVSEDSYQAKSFPTIKCNESKWHFDEV